MIAVVIPKRAASCKSCGKAFRPMDRCISTLKREVDALLREDFCTSCPPGKGDASWKNCVEKKLPVLESDMAEWKERFLNSIENLAKEPSSGMAAETYLLAHLLVRQKKLLLKKEPFLLEERKGALFQDIAGEETFFIEHCFSLFELGEAKSRLKEPWIKKG